jgi:hypothetical protein
VAISTPERLIGRCAAAVEGAQAAEAWVIEARDGSESLDADADGLIERLRRTRNQARRLGAAASRPMAAGFFGLSQAGKSYLISALARGANGSLETLMDGERLNFISHINPPGGGKEATGIVTRFTRRPTQGPSGFPVALSLLSEADLIKIIGNTYFLDFDREKRGEAFDHDRLRAHLAPFAKLVRDRDAGGLSADGVVDVMDYFVKRFPSSMEVFEADFWKAATRLAPRLAPRERAELLSPLWGGVEELTAAYVRLQGGLSRLGHASAAHAELAALVKPDGAGGFTQSDSIMNVDMLARLGRDDADTVNVAPVIDGEVRSSVGIPRSLLAALAREMTFVLADPPQAKLLETVDLLDFPGYRGRLKVGNLKEVAERLEGRDPVAELILRGKVAYLFERYTDDQEMNVLVMCTPCHKQSDVQDIGGALTEWIASTQGETPEIRAARKPGLIWALTMFDMRLTPKPDETEDLIRNGWLGMMKLALLEKFEQFEWVNKWTPNAPFANLFLVRKPGMAAGVIRSDGDGRRETGIEPSQAERLAMLRRTFVADPTVGRHIADPAAAWDAMMALDDGGMAALIAYLEDVAKPEAKFARIAERVDTLVRRLVEDDLGPYRFREGEDALKEKQEKAKRVTAALAERAFMLGELLSLMQPSLEHVRGLYLSSEEAAKDEETPTGVLGGGFVSLDLEVPVADAVPESSSARAFARALFSDWQARLRALPRSPETARFLQLPEEVLQILVTEVVVGANRLKVENRLVDHLREAEDRSGTTRARLADQQALVARGAIAEYVDSLGYGEMPEDKRPVSSRLPGHRLFGSPPAFTGLPKISERPLNYPAIRICDWLDAFTAVAIENIGRDEGREISLEQSRRLDAILKGVEAGGQTEAR